MKPFLLTTLTTAMALMIFLACSPVQAEEECLEQLEQKCTSCHYNTRICKKLEKKNRWAWKKSVKRMLRYGLKLDKQEQEKIVDCLLALKEEPGPFCK